MEDPVTAAVRAEAIRKVAEFLRLNYPCECPPEDPDCDDLDSLDEACSIVEIVEGILLRTSACPDPACYHNAREKN